MNKRAAINTAMTVISFSLAGAGFAGMMMIAPLFTMCMLGAAGICFLIAAIYRIECSRIDCERTQAELRKMR